jgi:hypothetical protein
MDENTLPQDVVAFVRLHIASVPHLEVLISMIRSGDERFSATDLAARTNLTPAVAASAAADLVRSGLLTAEGSGYRFAPATEVLNSVSASLAGCYDRFPVQLIRLIYEPRSAVQSFADAFRLKKE